MKLKFRIEEKGGAGSGHHGHAGRPGKHGGSLPGSGGSGSGWSDTSKGKSKSWEMTKGPARAMIVETVDGNSKWLNVNFSLTDDAKREMYNAEKGSAGRGKYWDTERVLQGKDFGQWVSEYSSQQKWDASDLAEAQKWASSMIDDYGKKLVTPRKKLPRSVPQLPYYD